MSTTNHDMTNPARTSRLSHNPADQWNEYARVLDQIEEAGGVWNALREGISIDPFAAPELAHEWTAIWEHFTKLDKAMTALDDHLNAAARRGRSPNEAARVLEEVEEAGGPWQAIAGLRVNAKADKFLDSVVTTLQRDYYPLSTRANAFVKLCRKNADYGQ